MESAADGVRTTTEALAEHAQTVMETAALALDLQMEAVRQLEPHQADGGKIAPNQIGSNQIASRQTASGQTASGQTASGQVASGQIASGQIASREIDWGQIGASWPLHEFLANLVRRLPQLQSAFFVDPHGLNSNSSRAFPMPPFDVSAREYYRAARNGVTDLVVSAPFMSESAGMVGFTVSRALVRNGRFDGLAAVTLSPGYFRRFYQSVLDHGHSAGAALLRTDGVILVRYPESATLPVRLQPDNAFLARAQAAESGFYVGRSLAGDQAKLVAFRHVDGQPLIVTAALDRSAVLRPWYVHMIFFTLFAALASIALMLVARRATLQADRDEASLRSLVAETDRRRQAEAALQQSAKMEALGRLTGGVAHDFNNLLAAILGSVELAIRRNADPRLERLLTVAHEAAQRGAKLTAQMLAFARRQRIELRAVAVNDVIHGADELLRRTCGPSVEIVFNLQEGLPPARADPMQLELTLLNLAANARDAMGEGGRLTLRTRHAADDPSRPPELASGEYIVVSVADTGPGMTEEVRRRAFEPFFTTKEPGHGTGLGLSMVLGVAQHAGGTAAIESAPGAGTTVSLWLPRAVEESRTAGEPVAANPERLRILLVDDDASVRASIGEMLEHLGHAVTVAADGKQALAALQADTKLDLLLLDYLMPGMNGGELAAAAQRFRPSLPLLFISGYVADDGLRQWTARGFKVLRKPFQLAGLAATVREVVGGQGRTSTETRGSVV